MAGGSETQPRALAVSEISHAAFEARYSLLRLTPLFAASLAMAILGAWLISSASGLLVTLAGIAAAAFCGLVACVYAARLMDRRVQIRIDAGGMIVRAHSEAPIKLRSIKRLHLITGGIALDLFKPSMYPSTRTLRRWVITMNNKVEAGAMGDVWLPMGLFDANSADLFAAIDRFRTPTDFERELELRLKAAQPSPPA